MNPAEPYGLSGVPEEVEAVCPYPRVFVTVSGAHLYGFPSQDSDLDLRGVHVLPAEEVVGLVRGPETLTWMSEDRQTDLVTHDLLKFCGLLLRRNGYVLEQLLSPLVLETTAVHEELVSLAPRLVTRHHAHHYLGFARTQWRLHGKTGGLKPLLYTFRVLLTGIHLMRTGEVLCDLAALHAAQGGPGYLPELIGLKRSAEHAAAPEGDFAPDVEALRARLEEAHAASALPERPEDGGALHRLVVRTRLRGRAD